MNWLFNGIGTQIVIWLITALLGGGIGYGIGIHRVKQIQRANGNSKQRQELKLDANVRGEQRKDSSVKLRQSQKAKDSVTQVQIGEVYRGKGK